MVKKVIKNAVDKIINDLADNHLEAWSERYKEYDKEDLKYDLNVNHDFSCELESIAEEIGKPNYDFSSEEYDYIVNAFTERVVETFEPQIIEKSLFIDCGYDLEFSSEDEDYTIKENLESLSSKMNLSVIENIEQSSFNKYLKNDTIKTKLIESITDVLIRQVAYDLKENIYDDDIDKRVFINDLMEFKNTPIKYAPTIQETLQNLDSNPEFLNIAQAVQLDYNYDDISLIDENCFLKNDNIALTLHIANNEITNNINLEKQAIHLNKISNYVEHTQSEISKIQATNKDMYVKSLDETDRNIFTDFYLQNLNDCGMRIDDYKKDILNAYFPSCAQIIIDKYDQRDNMTVNYKDKTYEFNYYDNKLNEKVGYELETALSKDIDYSFKHTFVDTSETLSEIYTHAITSHVLTNLFQETPLKEYPFSDSYKNMFYTQDQDLLEHSASNINEKLDHGSIGVSLMENQIKEIMNDISYKNNSVPGDINPTNKEHLDNLMKLVLDENKELQQSKKINKNIDISDDM